MTSSCDSIFQGVSSPKWHQVKIFANSIYKRVISSSAYADVSAFQQKGVEMFLQNIWSVYKNLVTKFQAFLKASTICKPNFHQVECTHPVL